MLWHFVLPFKITLSVLAGLVAVVTVLAPAFKFKRVQAFAATLLFSVVAFIPSCAGVKWIVDKDRFGEFHFGSAAQVQDRHLRGWLPPTATDITVFAFEQGFQARFRISESDLAAFMDETWRKHGDYSAESRESLQANDDVTPSDFEEWFGDRNWPPLADAKKHHSPVAADWAGFTIWHSAREGIAYESAGYW